MILLSSLPHAIASEAHKIVSEFHTISGKILPILEKAQADAQTVEAVTAVIAPQAVNLERIAFALLGVAIAALKDADAAAAANGLDLKLDAQLVADLKAVQPALKGATA